MPEAFSHTAHALDTDTAGRSLVALAAAALLLLLWSGWFFMARIAVYVTTNAARIEVARSVHPIDAAVSGRVVQLQLELDQVVQQGDVVALLDSETEVRELARARAKADGIELQRAAIQSQIAAERRTLTDLEQERGAALREARSRISGASVAAKLAHAQAARAETLRQQGSLTLAEAQRATAEAEEHSASVAGLIAQLSRQRHEYSTNRDDRRTRIASLARDATTLDAELSELRAQVAALEHAIQLRSVRAPASGRIGEIGAVRPGAFVRQGERLATIVSAGDLHVIAELAPSDALGRVRSGQSARLRFQGFPWTEFGQATLQVQEVAREVRDEHVRVQLQLLQSPAAVPLQHGLPGQLEIEVDHASPAQLMLRAIGQPTPLRPARGRTVADDGAVVAR